MRGPEKRPNTIRDEGLITDPHKLSRLVNGHGWERICPELGGRKRGTMGDWQKARLEILKEGAPLGGQDFDETAASRAMTNAFFDRENQRLRYLLEHNLLGGPALQSALRWFGAPGMRGPERRPHKPLEGLINDPRVLHDLKNAVGWEQTGLDPKLASGWDPTPEEWALAEKVALAEAPRRVASDSDYDEEVSLLAQIYAYRRGQRDRLACLLAHHRLAGEAEKRARALLDQHAQAETYRRQTADKVWRSE